MHFNIKQIIEESHILNELEIKLFIQRIDMMIIFSDILAEDGMKLILMTEKDYPIKVDINNEQITFIDFIINFEKHCSLDFNLLKSYINTVSFFVDKMYNIHSDDYKKLNHPSNIEINNNLEWLKIMGILTDQEELYPIYLFTKINQNTPQQQVNKKSSKI